MLPDDEHDEHQRRAAEQRRPDQPAGMHADDRGGLGERRVELGRGELGDALADHATRRGCRRPALAAVSTRLPEARVRMSRRSSSARALAEVGELHVRVGARPGDLEPGGAEHPGEQRPDDVDALDAVEPRLAVRAEQDAAAHLDQLVGDAEGVHAPRQVEPADEQQQRDQRSRPARSGRGRGRRSRRRDRPGAPLPPKNNSIRRSRRLAMTMPRIAISAMPPRSSGVAGCRRCHSPSARFSDGSGAGAGRSQPGPAALGQVDEVVAQLLRRRLRAVRGW